LAQRGFFSKYRRGTFIAEYFFLNHLAGRKQRAPSPQTAGTACVPAVFLLQLIVTLNQCEFHERVKMLYPKSERPHNLRYAESLARPASPL